MAKLFAFEEDTLVEDAAAPQAEVQAEQEVSELAEDAGGVDEGVAAVDDGEEAAAQLEEVGEVVAGTVDGEGEQQGLDPVAAEAVRIAVESICARMGASTKQFYALYATENFSSKSSRVANTKIALESIVETLKGVWAKIVAFLKGLVAKVVGFWNKLVHNVNGAQKAIKALQKKVKDISGSKPSDKDSKEYVVPGSVRKAFCAADLSTNVAIGKLKDITMVVGGFSDAFATVTKGGAIQFNNNMSGGVMLTFGKKLVAKSLTKSVDEGKEKIEFSVEITDSGDEQPETSKSQVLSKSEMSSVLQTASDMLTEQSKMSNQVNRLNDLLRAKESAFDKAIAAAARMGDGPGKEKATDDQKEMMTQFKKERADFVALIKMASPKLQVIAVRSARASMDYVKSSMALYK